MRMLDTVPCGGCRQEVPLGKIAPLPRARAVRVEGEGGRAGRRDTRPVRLRCPGCPTPSPPAPHFCFQTGRKPKHYGEKRKFPRGFRQNPVGISSGSRRVLPLFPPPAGGKRSLRLGDGPDAREIVRRKTRSGGQANAAPDAFRGVAYATNSARPRPARFLVMTIQRR